MTRPALSSVCKPKRILLLCRNQILDEYVPALILAGVLVGLNLIGLWTLGEAPMISRAAGYAQFPQLWGLAVLLFGFYYAGRSFRAMHGRNTTDWLLLPASSLEKYGATLVWLFVVWPLAGSLLASLSSALLGLIQLIWRGPAFSLWHPFNREGLRLLTGYWLMATVLLAGSTVFKRHALVKTLGLVIAALTLAMLIATPIFMSIVANLDSEAHLSIINGQVETSGQLALDEAGRKVQWLLNAWTYVLVPASALAFSYFRIREKEARDEVQ